ncbi:SPOR domain-containing protein [Archaeoglobus veneficus]|uniref:Uncharacterized protein n=1 Tax=Archaeoglobus veneficus (strain DSM 11195 / SNP6) TaxID=693661 RepID=F2KSH9_ARCVS|nr:hypothetical protein [Archaeoglobus veneficus]AEA48049.1 hypothetical protein Arcve_2059 [Archaeoglobus veneficus SNP6]
MKPKTFEEKFGQQQPTETVYQVIAFIKDEGKARRLMERIRKAGYSVIMVRSEGCL